MARFKNQIQSSFAKCERVNNSCFAGFTMFFIQGSLSILTKADVSAGTTLTKNWLGILIKVLVIFFLLPILFRLIPEMPFGDISVILTCGPCLLVAIFAFVLFGEKLSQCQVVLIILSSFGVIFIIRPAFIFGTTNADNVYPNRYFLIYENSSKTFFETLRQKFVVLFLRNPR